MSHYFLAAIISFILGCGAATKTFGKPLTIIFNLSVVTIVIIILYRVVFINFESAVEAFWIGISIVVGGSVGFVLNKKLPKDSDFKRIHVVPARHDIFVSYKSENVNEVRRLVDFLLANSIKVWFAEYSVLFENYERFAEEVHKGVASAQHALIFTNNLWAESKWCQEEMEQILYQRKMKVEDIYEIRIPPEPRTQERYEILKNPHPVCDFDGDLSTVTEFFRKELPFEIGLDFPRKQLTDRNSKSWVIPQYGLSLNYGGLNFGYFTLPKHDLGKNTIERKGISPLTRIFFPRRSTVIGDYFVGRFEDHKAKMIVAYYPYNNSVSKISVRKSAKIDDRSIYSEYRAFARDWLIDERNDDKGLHLFFWQDSSHIAITHSVPSLQNKPGGWERRYVLSIANKRAGNKDGELHISFYVEFEVGSTDQSYKKFCKYALDFESIVSSVRI